MTRRALAVRQRYEAYEREAYGRAWSLEELTLGLVGDIGDLAKLVQAHEGVRNVENAGAALEHELADALWSLIAIAHRCGVDLESAFSRTMDELDDALGRFANRNAKPSC
jgi:NTP pyrophosphatase (non-canonical NTP hydrolase)